MGGLCPSGRKQRLWGQDRAPGLRPLKHTGRLSPALALVCTDHLARVFPSSPHYSVPVQRALRQCRGHTVMWASAACGSHCHPHPSPRPPPWPTPPSQLPTSGLQGAHAQARTCQGSPRVPTLLRVVRGDGGARAVRAHALQALHGQLLQAPLQEAVLPLQLLLDAQCPAVLLLQFLELGGRCEPGGHPLPHRGTEAWAGFPSSTQPEPRATVYLVPAGPEGWMHPWFTPPGCYTRCTRQPSAWWPLTSSRRPTVPSQLSQAKSHVGREPWDSTSQVWVPPPPEDSAAHGGCSLHTLRPPGPARLAPAFSSPSPAPRLACAGRARGMAVPLSKPQPRCLWMPHRCRPPGPYLGLLERD